MVQLYADGVLIYEPGMEGYELLGLTATVSTEAGGTAEIVLPPDHPAYNAFVGFKTLVSIYRSGELIFRGRALFPTDDFYNRRTITCEGELCFLRDAVIGPYKYQTSPTVIFTDAINKYNAQVESHKRFRIGAITAKDPNDYQYIESESATQISDVIDKLTEYVGGHITFTTASDGVRVINWLEELENTSDQVIEFGENLLDYTRSDANADLATVIYPYGAKDEATGERVTIESVNDGKLYIQDEVAVALRGRIAKPVFWDDVTIPSNLLTKAKKYLETSKMIVSTLTLTAVDLSAIDQSLDSFRAGDKVRVLSIPHGVDDTFDLRERTYNLLDPSEDTIVLGKETLMLTRADTAGDADAINRLVKVTQNITNEYKTYIDQAIADIPGVTDLEELTQRVEEHESTISQQQDEIATKVSRTEYEVALSEKADEADLEAVGKRMSEAESTITQLADEIESQVSREEFDDLGTRVNAAESTITQQANEIASKVSTQELETALLNKADKGEVINNFVQLEEPVAQNIGDIWTQMDARVWETLKGYTWAQLKTNTWDAAMGYPKPKMYVWDGMQWVLENDARLISSVTEYESSITQLANKIETKVSKTEYDLDMGTMETRVSNAESKVTQDADKWTAEFNKIGLAGSQTGITKVDASGVEVTHSNIGGKTSMNADGFKLYDANGNVIGGLMSIDGASVSAVQRLANLLSTTFYLAVSPNIYGDGEHGVEFIIDGVNCGAITAQYLDGDVMGMHIRSNGGITFQAGSSSASFAEIYGMGRKIRYAGDDPGGNDGDIWLCPVEE